ncbi:hypothetical protein [Butyrivibrio sp. XPD2002]|uniref:hypothetical protein n=1 Tax=Butyrivibrio sp. XPD2002 TaxID=1280665 RepID=UPI00040A3598|nr:hypothetical protein [Butyrivibrio sp. XPD2002]
MKTKHIFVVFAITIFSLLLVIYYGSCKTGYYSDEVWTYGLANNLSGIYPKVETGIKYSGYGPFDSFVKAKDGARFNITNVWKNQSDDVHPPFYYILINVVCSLFPDTYSKWYGITVNIFWMILIIPLLYKLSNKITASTIASTGITIAYAFSVIFMDTLVFIRMYTQLTFFTIAISYLIKLYWNKRLDKKFHALLSIILILGMLTHYYFLIFTFFVCILFAIHLYRQKRNGELKKAALVTLFTGIIYSIIWHQFWIHLFFRHRGRQAIYHAIVPKNIVMGPLIMLSDLNYEAFAGGMGIFIILGIVLAVIKKKKRETFFGYNTFLLLSAFLYLFVIGTIAPFMDVRYVMSIAWIFILSAYIILRKLLIRISDKKVMEFVVLIVFIMINMYNHNLYGWRVPNDYYYPEQMDVMDSMKNYDTVVYLDEEWKPIIFFEELKHVKSYTFVDDSNAESVLNSMDGDYFLLTCVEKEAEENITNKLDAELKYYRAGRGYYFVKRED